MGIVSIQVVDVVELLLSKYFLSLVSGSVYQVMIVYGYLQQGLLLDFPVSV